MSLQEIFYVVAIIMMSVMTVLMVALIVLMFYLRSKILEIANSVERKVDRVTDLVTHPQKIALAVGEAVVDTAIDQIAKITQSPQRQRRRKISR